jgi:O-antigen biosynthesis protein
MDTDWVKNYPLLEERIDDVLGENSSLTKMSHFIGDNKRVLDFGCATGYFAHMLSQKGCVVTGLEINPDAAKVAEQHCQNVVVADLDFVSVLDVLPLQAFDVAVFGDVLEHLRNPWKVLIETKQLLKSDGYVVASIPNIAHGAIRLALLQGTFEYAELGILDNTHLRFFTRKTVEELFEGAGYALNRLDRTKLPIFGNDFLAPTINPLDFEPSLVEQITAAPESDTLQFIVQAFPVTLEGQLAAISDRHTKLLKEHEHLKSQLFTLQTEHQKIQHAYEHHDTELKQAYTDKTAIQAELERLWTEFQQLQTLHATAEAETERSHAQVRLTESELLIAQRTLQSQQSELASAQAELQAAHTQVHETQAQISRLSLTTEQLQIQLQASRQEVERLQTQEQTGQEQIQHVQAENQHLQADNQHLRSQLEDIQKQLKQSETTIRWMETSKFWELRKTWLSVKKAVGLAGSDR